MWKCVFIGVCDCSTILPTAAQTLNLFSILWPTMTCDSRSKLCAVSLLVLWPCVTWPIRFMTRCDLTCFMTMFDLTCFMTLCDLFYDPVTQPICFMTHAWPICFMTLCDLTYLFCDPVWPNLSILWPCDLTYLFYDPVWPKPSHKEWTMLAGDQNTQQNGLMEILQNKASPCLVQMFFYFVYFLIWHQTQNNNLIWETMYSGATKKKIYKKSDTKHVTIT